jgi:hypothetical protein
MAKNCSLWLLEQEVVSQLAGPCRERQRVGVHVAYCIFESDTTWAGLSCCCSDWLEDGRQQDDTFGRVIFGNCSSSVAVGK